MSLGVWGAGAGRFGRQESLSSRRRRRLQRSRRAHAGVVSPAPWLVTRTSDRVAGASFYGIDGWSIHKGELGGTWVRVGPASGPASARPRADAVRHPSHAAAHQPAHPPCASAAPGACGFGYQYKNLGTGWDVAAIADASPEFQGSCG